MAKFEIGDKVKFLNQVGGGVVTRITDDFIFVQDDTGFDLPLPPEELIRMADQQGAGRLFNATMEKHLADKGTADKDNAAAPVKKELSPEEEIRSLRSQVANLKDQVTKLRQQLSRLQAQGARQLSDNILLQYETAPGEAEVDLHIDNLAEHPDQLSAHEAFQIQMHFVRTCINHAFKNKMKRVVFIHGTGKGILKDEIIKELKKYDSLHFFDAPRAKYGAGATEVYFS